MLELYQSQYRGWNVKHFHEHLVKRFNFNWGYSWTKHQLQVSGLIERAPRRGAHRRKRPRKPCEGMMLHQDGSRHAWLASEPPLDLIVTLDDATSKIYSIFLIEEEGTVSTFQALLEVFIAQGLPCSLYTDRGSHYFLTPKVGGVVDKTQLTQVGRALDRLGIEHIPAYSPEARGRSERMFATLQDRLPKELELAGIAGIQAANRFIREVYLPEHNARFAVPGRPRLCPCRGARGGSDEILASRRSAWSATTTACPSEPQAPDPGKPAAPALRQGEGEGPPLSGRLARPLPWAALHRPLRPEGSDPESLNAPLKSARRHSLWKMWTTQTRLPAGPERRNC